MARNATTAGPYRLQHAHGCALAPLDLRLPQDLLRLRTYL